MIEILSLIGKLAYDKKLHFLAGFIISVVFTLLAYDVVGLTAGVMAGLGKEVYDYYDYGDFDQRDFLFTVAGSIAGVILVGLL